MTMQGPELKDIRTALGLSQGDFADALGLARETVGLMERAKAPIERRTAMAAHHLFNERSRLYGNHRAESLDSDVSLRDAMIIWDRNGEQSPAVQVVGPGGDDDAYFSSYGNGNADWAAADDVGRLLRLLSRFVELTVTEKLDPKEVHAAFSVIPEYREAMARGMFSDGIADPD